MGSSDLILSFVFISVTVFVNANPIINVDKDWVDEICKASFIPQFCLDLLNSDPRTSSASVSELAQNTIDKANSNAADAINLIEALLKGVTDPNLKQKYQLCMDKMKDATSKFDQAKAAVGSCNLGDLNDDVFAARSDVNDCGDVIGAEFPQLKDASQKLINIISVVLAISDRL